MTEDELFARRPLGMRMAMIVRQWRATIDHALADTGLTQSGWTVLMQLSQLGDNVSVSELAEVQGIELPPLMRTLTQLENQGCLRAPHRPMTSVSVCWRLRRKVMPCWKKSPL
jgi:MarR family transcriptional regulator for hemolysin